MENDCSQLINDGLLKTPGAGPVNDYPSPPKRRRTPSPQTRGHRKRFSQEKHFPPNGWMNQQAHMIGNQRPYRYNSFYRKNGQFQNHPVNPNAHYRPRMYNNNIYNNNNNSNNNSNNNNNSKNC
uniref:Uncharacterized protein n=2 Tax=Ciona intestinalis TaxID=7719 RepID=H2XTW0_CIOIN